MTRAIATRWIGCMMGLACLSGCTEMSVPVSSTTARETYSYEQSDICSFGAQLDRFFLGGTLARDFPMAPGVIAGYRTSWLPGADPFPCNRKHTVNVQGVFGFDVPASDPERPFVMARLELERAIPYRGVVTEPPSAGFGTGIISGGRPPARPGTCQFTVEKVEDPWRTTDGFRDGPFLATRPLAVPNAPPITIDSRGLTEPWSTDVSEEVRAWTEGFEPNLGFAVRVDDWSIRSNHDNNCVAHFRFVLRYFVKDPSAPGF